MKDLTRRTLLRLAGGAAVTAPGSGPKEVGRIKPRPSAAIRSSALSIGFETLDRTMFDPERTYVLLGQSGVKWARCHTGWARCERVKGEYDFRWLDEVVDRLQGQGIQPWFCLGFGNKLYIPDAINEFAVGWHPMRTREALQGWLNYTRAIAARFSGRVKHWEIWNEPNGWWRPDGPNPAAYVEFVRITALEIRERVPGAVIVGGALARGRAGTLARSGGTRPLDDSTILKRQSDFLERCLELGLAAHVDKISYHPYRAVPERNCENELNWLRALTARYRRDIQIWQGECGCPSQNGGSGGLSDLDWNEMRQAKWLLRRLLTDIRLGVELTSYFHTVDLVNYFSTDPKPRATNYKGVLRGTDYTPKPSYFALQSLCALFDGDTVRSDFPLLLGGAPELLAGGPEGIQRASFVRGRYPLYAYWCPADLQLDWPGCTVSTKVWNGEAVRLVNPVLVDLLEGKVYEIAASAVGGFVEFGGLPLRDYPLVITDRAVTG